MLDFIKQVSIGYDSLMKEIRFFKKEIEPDYNSPYNILKKDGKYQVQFYIPGIKQEDVFVGFEEGVLTIEAGKDGEDDEFVYRSVFDKVIKTKLMVARHLDVEKVEVIDGILYIDFVDLLPARRNRVIMSGMHVPPAPVVPDVPAVDIPVATETVVEVVNADVEEKPTVEVSLPVEMPVVVEIVDHHVSEEGTVTIDLADATAEVKTDEPVETIVVEMPVDVPNVVVVAPVETVAAIEAAGVDIAEVVAAAVASEEVTMPVDTAPVVETWTDAVVTDVPVETKEEFKDVVVSVPDTIPTVVEMVKTEDEKFEIVPVDMTEFKEDSYEQMVPVVTAEGSPDIMVAVSAEVKAEMEIKIEEPLQDVLAAVVQEAEPMVVTTADLGPVMPEPAVESVSEPIVSEPASQE